MVAGTFLAVAETEKAGWCMDERQPAEAKRPSTGLVC